ncbi:MAG TPA: TonB-dependent receptor plug domain-containing protein, partial [Polyangiaceae bacterium]
MPPLPVTVPDAPVDTVTVHSIPRVEEATATSIPTAEAKLVPGTEGDTVKVLQMLPGVARPSFGTGQLVVWGAAPEDTRVFVDGVEVPALYHLGGLRSILPSDLVRDVTLVPGAYGADYGRALGGIARVDTRALPSEGTHGFVAADTLDGSAMVSAAPSERVRIALAGRVGWLDRVMSAVSAPDVGDFYPIPRYGDWQAVSQIAL